MIWAALEEFGIIRQGATLSRIRSPEGMRLGVVQIRNLDALEVDNKLDEETFMTTRTDMHRTKMGDVLISLRSSPIKAAVVPAEVEGSVVGSNIAILTPHGNVSSTYLAGLLSSEFMRQQLDELIGGTIIPSLSVAVLRSVKLPMPNYEQQEAIAKGFRLLDRYKKLSYLLIEERETRMEAELARFFGDDSDR